MNFAPQPAPEPLRPERRGSRGGGWWLVVGVLVLAGAGIWFLKPAGARTENGAGPGASSGSLAAELEERVEELLETASQHGAAGRPEEAEAFLSEAAEVQREINERFPGVDGSAARRLQTIEVELQTLQAAPALAEVARLDALVAGHLRRREPREAVPMIRQAGEVMESAVASFPLARDQDDERRRRIGFLNEQQATLGWIQDLAIGGLVPDANSPGQARLETGPGWELYKQVMGPGAGGTAAEQAEFCRRLGWVLGVPVRPATEGAGAAGRAFQVLVEMGADGN